MNNIGIICPSDAELKPFLQRLSNPKITEKAMLRFYEGCLDSASVVILYSGVCKVNAAIAAQLLIDSFNVAAIINAGVAGGIDKNVQMFDTVVTEQAAYHDMTADILTEFHPWLDAVWFRSDSRLLDIVRQYSQTAAYPILFGKTVTGEQFIAEEGREKILQDFSPLAVDMETASIAHVCHVNKVPFIAIRTITDTAEHVGHENFEKNCEKASEISAEIVTAVLQRLTIEK